MQILKLDYIKKLQRSNHLSYIYLICKHISSVGNIISKKVFVIIFNLFIVILFLSHFDVFYYCSQNGYCANQLTLSQMIETLEELDGFSNSPSIC